MSIKDQITADLKDAMRARDQVRLDALRSAVSAFGYKRKEANVDPTEAEQLEIVRRLVKQRTDSIEQFQKAGRTELADKESREREILQTYLEQYLPAQKSPDEIRALVRETIAGLPPEGRNQGALMKTVLPQLKGLADGNVVRKIVLEELASA